MRQHPGERYLRDADPVPARPRGQHVEDFKSSFFVDRRKVESGAARGLVTTVARELSREETAGQRTPDEQTEPLILEQRNHLAFQLAAGQRVKRLRAPKPFESLFARNRKRLHQLPRREIRAADVANLAGVHQIVEGAKRILEVRERIEPMDLIEVDVVGAEPLQARVDRLP